MATAFTVSIAPSGGDYTVLNTAATACACDLTSAATKVFSHGAITGTMSANTAVTGLTSGATGTCVVCTSSQILIKAITGTFQSGEVVYETLSVNLITISDAGNSPTLSLSISGTWASADTTQFSIGSGYTTNSTNTISISTTGSAVPPGVWTDASPYYRLKLTNSFGEIFNIGVANVTVTGIQIKNTSSSTDDPFTPKAFRVGDLTNVNLNRCIGIAPQLGLDMSCFGGTYQMRNCIFISTWAGTVRVGTSISIGNGGTINVLNCVLGQYNNGPGLNGNVNMTCNVKNCYAFSGSGAGFGSTHLTITTCASYDGSQSTTSAAYATGSGAFFTNVTQGSEDYHISSSSALKAAGTDLSGTFTDDIVGATRSAPYDIGVFIVTAGGFTSKFRKTLSMIGSGVGKRQAMGWGQ